MSQPIQLQCPACNGRIDLAPEYLAQYGGQTTTCPHCREPFRIPLPGEAVPQAVIPYASPLTGRPIGQIGFDGSGLVMAKGAVTPDRCVKCNAPADGYRWNKTLYWHHPALFVMILFPGLLIYAIVALCVRKSGRVGIGLCPIHRATRRRNAMIAWGVALLGLAMMIGGPMLGSTMPRREQETYMMVGLLGGLVTVLVGGILGATLVPVVTPRRIDEHWVYLNRAGEAFLRSLPRF